MFGWILPVLSLHPCEEAQLQPMRCRSTLWPHPWSSTLTAGGCTGLHGQVSSLSDSSLPQWVSPLTTEPCSPPGPLLSMSNNHTISRWLLWWRWKVALYFLHRSRTFSSLRWRSMYLDPCSFWGPEWLEALCPCPFLLYLYITHGKPLEAV